MESLHEECEVLKQREKVLMADMKKRGDAARQVVMTKDAEIHKLKLKLSGPATTSATAADSTPRSEPVSAPGSPTKGPVEGDVARVGEEEKKEQEDQAVAIADTPGPVPMPTPVRTSTAF